MDDMSKLKHLIDHWAEHNEEHVKTYLEWAEKAENSGYKELNAVLKEIAENTKNIDSLFKKAKQIIKK